MMTTSSLGRHLLEKFFPFRMSEHTRGGTATATMTAPTTNILGHDDDDASKVEVIVYTKSDKTLKQNMNAKDETLRKRTSLIIVPQMETTTTTTAGSPSIVVSATSVTSMDSSTNENGNRNSIASMDSCVSHTTSQSNQSSTGSSNSSSSSSSDHHDDDAVYQDLQNGNAESERDDDAPNQQLLLHSPAASCTSSLESPSSSCASSSSSSSSCASSVDYSLREQLKNFANLNQNNDELKTGAGNDLPNAAQLLKDITTGPMIASDTLLSPQEVPLGRRYAEVSQFKGHHGKARASESSSLPTAPLVATPNTVETSTTLPVAVSCHNNNNNNNNNNINNNGQQSEKCPQQQQQQHSTNLNKANQKLNGPSNINNNNINSMTPANLNETTKKNAESLETDADAEDNVDSAHDADGAFEDDMQALLPQCARRSRDELSQSRTSLASEGGILAEGETSSEESSRDSSDNSPPCDLGLVERLLLTHPMWFLPGIQRSGAVHLLQGKEEGTFIVRGSSQPNTMAVSVRLPQDTGPYIEHYLIQSQDNVLSLESSRFKFGSIPALIAHYAQCCDELPVQLMLPRVLREANNRKKLSSLALLGQEFWSYASSPAVLGGGPPLIGGGAATTKGGATQIDQQLLLDAKSPLSLTETSGLGTATFFSEHPQQKEQKQQQPQQQQQQSAGGIANYYPTPSPSIFSPTGSGQLMGFFSQAGTPSDTTSSMSSFSTSGVGGAINSAGQHLQLLSPNSVDSVILTMSSPTMETLPSSNSNLMEAQPLANPNPNLSTFKTNGANGGEAGPEQILQRSQRPKPPNTLNLKPPAPPLRWSKPHSPDQMSSNFTVTTTVTFSMENNGGQANATPNANPPQFVEVTTPASSNPFNALLNGQSSTFQTFAKRLSPEGECKDTISSQGSSSTDSRWQSSQRKILSPLTPSGSTSNTNSKSRKSRARKESQHYQESDILESPQLQYCASALSDKISDYEDVWSHDPSDRATLLTSFKPSLETVGGVMNRRPDLLAETPGTLTPSEEQQMDGQQQLMQFSADAQPRSRAGLLLPISHHSNPQPTESSQDDGGDTTPTAAQTPGSRSKQGSPFYAEPADALRQAGLTNAAAAILRRQQRNQLLPATQRHSEPLKGGLAAAASGSPLLLPAELEKLAAGSLDELKQKPNQKPQANKRPRNRFENWQLDSSWEFMAKQQQETTSRPFDYETTKIANDWQQMEKENSLGRDRSESGKKRPLTVHQIILKHLPDLNLPELVRCSTPPTTGTGTATATQMPLQEKTLTGTGPIGLGLGMGMGLGLSDGGGSQKSFQSQSNGCRLSAYDNVERNCAAAFCQTYYGGIDSAQSDDGTVFSEPWDSTQWDSFMPQDDATINSDTIHLSKCRPALSEDDTIIEEYSSTKDGSQSGQDTLKANKNGGSQTINNNSNNNNNNNAKQSNNRPKVATIVRNPSMRDREVLCHPRNKMNIQSCGPGDSLRAYTLQLAQDPSSTFARQIENFICCTKESREAAPQVIMRNMRQFMSGMKNYLVKHGEGKFHSELETARARLKADEFLNLDAMLETVMHQLVVLPLREHLYGIFVDYYKRSEDIQLLAQNVRYACERDAADFGIRPTVTPPSVSALRLISNLLWRLQEAELPLDKLELFLCVISTVFDATGCPRGQQLGADDFLPVLVYVVAKCGFVGAEIEAEFMWGLLQPTLLNGEPGYYLTALCSAVQVLKTFMASEGESGSGSLDWRSSCLPACSSVLRVIIPDECNGSLQTRTLPVRPHTTTREVCRIIAHKARITNPQDYALFKLVDGEETLLTDAECPQDARLAAKGKHCMLAYKRIDAKIAWPTTATQTATQSAGGVGHSNGH
ncbi:protein sprint isoform X2 [Drosophila willistoni]|uniref:protein sprint isoform X2 n=1 Tax=Drosophila willistoni TaxID=7260 RepID=UPI000C26D1AE|nr:protein sprint isoform X2 [Drosophila willistoni]